MQPTYFLTKYFWIKNAAYFYAAEEHNPLARVLSAQSIVLLHKSESNIRLTVDKQQNSRRRP